MGNGLCDICLGKSLTGNGNGQDDYAYETFKKIPIIGRISEYLRMWKNPSAQQYNNNNNSNFNSIINPFGPSGQRSTIPGHSSVIPPAPFSFANLINNSPLDFIKESQLLDIGDQSYMRKIKKSNYDQLTKQMTGTSQLYTDPDFPPNEKSLGALQSKMRKSLSWKRIKDIISSPIFVKDKISPSDILQGSLGDCYFLSALASLAEQDYRIKSIFPNLQVNPNGFYMARILHNGVLQEVLIDDYFPVYSNNKFGFAQPAGGVQIWVMVLEKCWAKLYGSYANIVGGLPHQVLHAFTSAPVFYRPIPSNKEKQDVLWNEMLQNQRNGSLLCCGTKGDESVEEKGFVKGHAYTILGIYDQPQRMIKLRNPWGHKEWKGKASDFDKQFWASVSPANKQALEYQDSKRQTDSDGIFFILWEDFLIYFQLVDICKINDNAHYNFVQAPFQHLTPSLYSIEVGKNNQPNNKLTLALTQQTNRGKGQEAENRGYSRSFLALGKLDQSTGKYKYVSSNSAKTFPDNYMELNSVGPGKYVLYSKYLWNNGNQQNKATLSAYSAAPATIQQAPLSPSKFLEEIFYDHASQNAKRKDLPNSGDWVCNDILLNNGGFGYVVVNVDPKSSTKLSVQMKQADYTQRKIAFENPHKGKGQILEEVNSSKPLIVVLTIPSESFPSSISLPQPQIRPLS